MNNNLVKIALLIIVIIVAAVIYNAVRKGDMSPAVVSPDQLLRMETGELNDNDLVVVTLEDNLYHLSGCSHISGHTDIMTFSKAREKGYVLCPNCIRIGESSDTYDERVEFKSSSPTEPDIVVVTAGDSLYHNPDCDWIGRGARRMSTENAIKKGFHPCPQCIDEE
ncbi:MAG: hypothetical protein P9X24_14385 [Candidatus Hatepunaea meridiana]|nr:hypothetical protein [Candidatus Hatepunaea meridiana]